LSDSNHTLHPYTQFHDTGHTDRSAAQVDEEKPECPLVQPLKGHTMIQLDGTCNTEIVAGETIEGFTFEPRCLVLVMALENERAMFDSMLAAGRILSDPFVS